MDIPDFEEGHDIGQQIEDIWGGLNGRCCRGVGAKGCDAKKNDWSSGEEETWNDMLHESSEACSQYCIP